MEYITNSEVESQKVAQKFALKLKPGSVLALFGDLGSGKTAFTKGLAHALGVDDVVTSPTFVFVKEYPINKFQISNFKFQNNSKTIESKLIHVDCYRMSNANDAEAIGLREYFESKSNIVVIEWADRIEFILPKDTIRINFENLGQDKRKIIINLTDEK